MGALRARAARDNRSRHLCHTGQHPGAQARDGEWLMAAASPVSRFEPEDQYNRTLADNVHPSDWVNPVAKRNYNLVVVGGGTAGLVTAAGAAGLGASVALV